VAELRWGIEGEVDRWLTHHGLEVGSGPAHAGRRRRSTSSRRKKGNAWAGWAAWATQARWSAGLTEPKARKNSFQNKIGILKIAKALGICTRRFRSYFDVGIFLNSSRILKDFRKIQYAMP
jgi:hypothetical protein